MARYGCTTSIKRLASSYNAARNRREREELIQLSASAATEKPSVYSICNFEFNEATRVCRVEFLEAKEYRTIERYVTQNYVKHPIYGAWKQKTKIIKKTLKLTNEALETLNQSDDFLVNHFATEIIERLDNENLIPSWFAKVLIEDDFIVNTENNNRAFSAFKTRNLSLQSQNKNQILKDNQEIETLGKMLEVGKNRISKFKNRRDNKNKALFIVLGVITFGIYPILNRKTRLTNLIAKEEKVIDDIEKNIVSKKNEIDSLQKENENYANDLIKEEKELNKKNEALKIQYEKNISLIKPLLTDIAQASDEFIPLKQLAAAKYEKIIGCYVIHNKEFDKYYVGQSKDVMKRVTRDHFNGTQVRNIIFAEDYFKSKWENKDDLFEVKIIRLQTKDELDRTEKELIEFYDSFNNGYNSTGGNS